MTRELPEFTLELVAGAAAFGNGEHPTTQMALQVLYALATQRDFTNILDMGCGAGLLGMTAARLWPRAQVLAADIEPAAVATAARNIAHNGLDARMTALRSDGYKHPAITAAAPFDLILCNITADPIVRLAPALPRVLAESGVAVLSGVLLWRSAEVLALHAQQGLHPVLPTLSSEGWETHVLSRAAL